MTQRRGVSSAACFALMALMGACGDDGNDSSGQQQAIDNADCSDPGQNPYAEIACVTDFMGACFVPTGMCTGVVKTSELGKTTLTWTSGHSIEAEPFIDFAFDPANPTVSVENATKSSGADILIKDASGG